MNNNNSNINNNNIAIDRYNIRNNNINKSTTSNNMPTRSYRHIAFDGTSVGPILFSSNCSCPPISAHLSLRRGQVSRTDMRYISPRRARGRAAKSFVIKRTKNKKIRFRKEYSEKEKNERGLEILLTLSHSLRAPPP